MDQENSTKRSSSHQRKKNYRNLLTRIEGLQENDDVGINTVKSLYHIFQEVSLMDNQCEFSKRVEYADETLLESVVLSSASGILVKCFENFDIFQSAYEPTEFASNILNTIKQPGEEFETNNWLSLLDIARSIVPDLPSYNFLYGSFDPTMTPLPKERKQQVRREAQEKVEKKRLEIIKKVEQDEEGIDDTVNYLLKVLTDEYQENDCEAISYYDFIIDSNSFFTTVENIFYTSFLIRDGKAQLTIDDTNTARLRPMRKRDLKAFRKEGGINTQMITSISMDEWEDLRKTTGFIQSHKNRRSQQCF